MGAVRQRGPHSVSGIAYLPVDTFFVDVWTGIDRIREVVVERRHESYLTSRLAVT